MNSGSSTCPLPRPTHRVLSVPGLGTALLSWLLLACSPTVHAASSIARWYSVPAFQSGSWSVSTNSIHPGAPVWTSPVWQTPEAWTEAVLSWKSLVPPQPTPAFAYRFEVRPGPMDSGRSNPLFLSLGQWSSFPAFLESRSEPPFTNDWASVSTDLIQLHTPARTFQIRVTLLGDSKAAQEQLVNLMLSTRSAGSPPPENHPARSKVWGAPPLEVPPLSQHAFPGGKSWCSPTCLAMLLGYWSTQVPLSSPLPSVPQIAARVHDSTWGGTGNWSFNVAYLNAEKSLQSVALRLQGLQDIEQSIAARCPVVISVSLNLMRGLPRTRIRDGHLVVVCGFDEKGDVWVNDPDSTHPPVPTKPVRRKYRREDVLKAWDYSNRTAYLTWPTQQSGRPPVPSTPLHELAPQP